MNSRLLEHALACEVCRNALERILLQEDVVQHALEAGITPPGRPQAELQNAHDLLLDALQTRTVRERLLPEPLACQIAMAADCLCWALGHTHLNDRRLGNNFHALLVDLEIAMRPWEFARSLQEIAHPTTKPVERKPPKTRESRKKPAPVPSMDFAFEEEERG